MKHILCAIMSLLLFVACTSEEVTSSIQTGGNESVTPSITLDQNYLNFDEHADVQTISFSSTMDWTAELINDRADGWCSISATSGTAGSREIDVTVTENTSTDDRTASVIIKSGAISKTVRISQKQRDALTVTTSTFEVESTKGKIYIEVKANIDFEYTINGSAAEWITPIQTRALKTTKLGFNIAENNTFSNREGTITIHSGNMQEVVTVYQKGNNDVILISQNEFIISDEGEDIAIEVTSNLDVAIEMPDVDWITRNTSRAVSTNTYYFTIAENTSYNQREAYIIFKNTEKNITERVKITQVQKDAMIIAKSTYNVDSEGEQITIEIGHNIDFDYEILGNWITTVNTRAFITDNLIFNVASNSGYDSREGSIIFTSKDGLLSQTVKIFQAQKDAVIISDNDIIISNDSQQVSFEIVANVVYSVSEPNVDWLHLINTRALTSQTLTYDVEENTTYDSREAQIVVTNKANNTTQTITITQAQKDAIVLVASTYEIQKEGGELDFDIQANVEVKVSIAEDAKRWITHLTSRALQTQTLHFDIAAYDGDDTREGVITLSGGGVTQTVTICQSSWQNLKNNKIYYTSSDGNIVEPSEYASWGDVKITSNTYENGQGVITFNKNLTSIGNSAFHDCSSLTSINIPDSVTSIEKYAFKQCSALTSITIPEGVTSIEEYAFDDCSSLTSITIPDGVTEIELGTFSGCFSLKSITIPDSVTSIGSDAFYGCQSLKSINLPNGLTEIGGCAFYGCQSLKSINFPNGLTEIGGLAFADCDSLTSITIPESVIWIGDGAFCYCTSLTSIYLRATTPPTLGTFPFDDPLNRDYNKTIYVPRASVDVYKSAESWKQYTVIIGYDF